MEKEISIKFEYAENGIYAEQVDKQGDPCMLSKVYLKGEKSYQETICNAMADFANIMYPNSNEQPVMYAKVILSEKPIA